MKIGCLALFALGSGFARADLYLLGTAHYPIVGNFPSISNHVRILDVQPTSDGGIYVLTLSDLGTTRGFVQFLRLTKYLGTGGRAWSRTLSTNTGAPTTGPNRDMHLSVNPANDDAIVVRNGEGSRTPKLYIHRFSSNGDLIRNRILNSLLDIAYGNKHTASSTLLAWSQSGSLYLLP